MTPGPPDLALESLELAYRSRPPICALSDCSLMISGGECVAVLGASGCGKTTLLRAVAGLVPLDAGRVVFGGRDMVRVPPHRRGVGFVFQHDALFTHATAAENIAFGLHAHGVSRAEISARVRAGARRTRVEHALERRVQTLSGGERQRVAIARALATDPCVLLFDEPLSRLDAPLRTTLRAELAALVRARTVTTLYVTHDQTEAVALGDRIAIMREGTIVQVGTPKELFERPRDLFVAAALGSPIGISEPGARVGIRSANVRITSDGTLAGIVTTLDELLDAAFASIEGDFGTVTARIDGVRPHVGERVRLAIDWSSALYFAADGTRRDLPVHA